jgi:hypothetical protein
LRPLTAAIDADGGVIGKPSPGFRIFLWALAGRRKNHFLILIYFQLLNVNVVGDLRSILRFSGPVRK